MASDASDPVHPRPILPAAAIEAATAGRPRHGIDRHPRRGRRRPGPDHRSHLPGRSGPPWRLPAWPRRLERRARPRRSLSSAQRTNPARGRRAGGGAASTRVARGRGTVVDRDASFRWWSASAESRRCYGRMDLAGPHATSDADRAPPISSPWPPSPSTGRGSASNAAERSEWFERMAHTDPLTGSPTAGPWHAVLELELARAAGKAARSSLALFDIDDFRAANASDGHQVDDILRRVAAVLAESVRLVDTVGRIGGTSSCSSRPGRQGPWSPERARIAASPAVAGRQVSVSAGVARFPADGR